MQVSLRGKLAKHVREPRESKPERAVVAEVPLKEKSIWQIRERAGLFICREGVAGWGATSWDLLSVTLPFGIHSFPDEQRLCALHQLSVPAWPLLLIR